MNLDGQVAIVTGGANGIGAACAHGFAAHGASVVVADLEAAASEAQAKAISGKTGQPTLGVACDVTDDAACAALFDKTLETFGKCDILLNNAGIIRAGTILDLDPDDFDRVMNVNMRSYFILTQLAARHMVERKIKGAILNMSSVNSVLAIPNQVAYVTSKGALQQLTKACALGLAEHGIRVNAIGPGSIMTDILKSVMTDETARKSILQRTPLGRVGEVEEIANVAVFLASDYASYITGQTIFPDGGRMALNYTVPVND